ncbi:pyridoxal phosphate-dependent decarboxylase family protein [Rhodopila sp.]|uniref:pyridoxal phosphate-dependent decarboxylase family protein n=1 Tax=Rhodopila sp. TaxID=2480087 RepID=UPI003D0FCB15
MNELFPPRNIRDAIDETLTCALGNACERVKAGSVTPTFDAAAFSEQLAQFDFHRPQPFEETLTWTIAQMECGLVHVTHPRYFGLFNPTPNYPAQCADKITAAFNPQLATATTSPAAVAIEAHVVASVAKRAGLPSGATGHFTTGGSEANYTAVILALAEGCPGFNEDGVRAFPGQPVFYVSEDSHLAWLKIARQAGLGLSAVNLVATDPEGCLDPEALRTAIEQDRLAGRVPVMVAATAGTTNAGMIDPLPACARIARETGLWFHVDAAWSGALIASAARRTLLCGIELADSVTIDAHKWFATTMGCGIFLTSHNDALHRTFRTTTGYMPSTTPADPYTSSIQWSRRFAGLRLFLALAAAGWDGYARHVEHTLLLAERLKAQIVNEGWIVLNRSPVGVACMSPGRPCSTRALVERVLASGQAWVSVARFQGRTVVRACITSGLTTAADVAILVDALVDAEKLVHLETQ